MPSASTIAAQKRKAIKKELRAAIYTATARKCLRNDDVRLILDRAADKSSSVKSDVLKHYTGILYDAIGNEITITKKKQFQKMVKPDIIPQTPVVKVVPVHTVIISVRQKLDGRISEPLTFSTELKGDVTQERVNEWVDEEFSKHRYFSGRYTVYGRVLWHVVGTVAKAVELKRSKKVIDKEIAARAAAVARSRNWAQLVQQSIDSLNPDHSLFIDDAPNRDGGNPIKMHGLAYEDLTTRPGYCAIDSIFHLLKPFIKNITVEEIQAVANGRTTPATCEARIKDGEIYSSYMTGYGTTAREIITIAKHYNCPVYGRMQTGELFVKEIAKTNRHIGPCICFYSTQSHLYLITDPKTIKSVVQSHVEGSTYKIAAEEKEHVKDKKFDTIYDNLSYSQLQDVKDCVVFYTKTTLQSLFFKIFRVENTIYATRGSGISYTHIFYKNNVQLMIDPNASSRHLVAGTPMSWRHIKAICDTSDIPFNGQCLASIAKSYSKKILDEINKRMNITEKIKVDVLGKSSGNCNMCRKPFTDVDPVEYDHITPVCQGGKTDKGNLQALHKSCHKLKCDQEQEAGVYNMQQKVTISEFNPEVQKLVDETPFFKALAHIETVGFYDENMPIYYHDMTKCRRNVMKYNKYDYPIFTVLDNITVYRDEELKPGFYYVEPVRPKNFKGLWFFKGNKFYAMPKVAMALEEGLITKDQIKYAYTSAITLPANFFTQIIDDLVNKCGLTYDIAKLLINTLCGLLGKTKYKTGKSIHSVSPHEIAVFCLKNPSYKNVCLPIGGPKMPDWLTGTHPDVRYFINKYSSEKLVEEPEYEDRHLYLAYKKEEISREATEVLLYNYIIDMESMELYKLSRLIQKKGGRVVWVNTDCVGYQRTDGEEDENGKLVDKAYDLSSHMWDPDTTDTPKYHVENKGDGAPDLFSRGVGDVTETFTFTPHKWDMIKDPGTNDFSGLISTVLDANKSVFISGSPGTGKSTLSNQIITEIKKRGITDKQILVSAPTNRAAMVLQNGITCHRLISSLCGPRKTLMKDRINKVKYIVCDEVSMMASSFYNLFLKIKKMNKNIIWIFVGDFLQLAPVKDRAEFDYEHSYALWYLCGGRKVVLTKCRRSDDRLYNIYMSGIHKVNKRGGHQFETDPKYNNTMHIAYTNAKVREINEVCQQRYLSRVIKKGEKTKISAIPDVYRASVDMYLCRGLPLIAFKTVTEKGVIVTCKNEFLKVCRVEGEGVILTRENGTEITAPLKTFAEVFRLAFAITAHRSQGATITENYTIHEWDRMDQRLKYVALSRGKNPEHISVNK